MSLFQMTLVIAIACLTVACQLMWMGHTIMGKSEECTNPANSGEAATSFLMPRDNNAQRRDSKKAETSAVQYPVSPLADKIARPFSPWTHPGLPCVAGEVDWNETNVVRSPAREGILFVRNMKTGSSTLAGVALRMARSMAARIRSNATAGSREEQMEMCKVRFDHSPAFRLEYGKRNKKNSYLWSFLRDPTDRTVSEFFHFGVSRMKMEPSDANFKRYMLEMRRYTRNYFVLDMSVKPFQPKKDPKYTLNKAIKSIMKEYDFIGLVERMDESLVAMKMLLGLDTNDILYLSAKRNGGFDEGAYRSQCYYIVPSFVSKGMKEFFNSKFWRDYTKGDRILFQAVNKSLDLTIDQLGRDEFERQLQDYQQEKKRAQQVCGPSTIYPCSAGGVRRRDGHSCLWWDSGCGYKCLDQLRSADEDDAAFADNSTRTVSKS